MKRVIIDTDAGVDDALAIILALKSPELRVEAITTVAGNVEVEKCTRNCLLILDILKLEHTPMVAQGAKKPLKRRLFTAPEVHGADGLGNATRHYPEPSRRAVKGNAGDVILRLVKKYPGEITVIALGPLTNLALAIRRGPRTMKDVKEIIAMAGAFRVPGNTGPVAEFNTYVDPDAAQQVLDAGLPLTLIPLDVTEQVKLYWTDIIERRNASSGKILSFISDVTRFYMDFHKQSLGFLGGYLHDPLTVGAAIKKRFVLTKKVHATVETRGEVTRGMTVAEFRSRFEQKPPNVDVAVGVQKEEFLNFFRSRVLV
jgi:inosine-uridine nucleoside N-ribohydrolase